MAQARFCQIGQDVAPGWPGIGGTFLVLTVQADAQAEGISSLLPPDAFEEHPQLGRGADHVLACGHDLLGISISARQQDSL
jgi:hypothetical protein